MVIAKPRPPTHVALAAVLVAVGVLVSVGVYLLLPGAPPASSNVTLSIVRAPGSSTYGFSAATVTVPADTLVHFTIVNFDPSAHGTRAGMTGTMGTWMGREMMDPGNGSWSNVSGLPTGEISHTFSVIGGGYDLNVLLPPAAAPGEPSIVQFWLPTHGAADLTWMCDADQMGAMMGGGMSGHFDID